jgi:hypothetical protein
MLHENSLLGICSGLLILTDRSRAWAQWHWAFAWPCINPTASMFCLVGSGCVSINEGSGPRAIGLTFWNEDMKMILIWWKGAMVQTLVSQGSAWEGNGERTVWFRRCPAAVKPLLAQAMVSQNARQSLNRRGSTCFFLMCKLLCTEPIFLLFTGFERISG